MRKADIKPGVVYAYKPKGMHPVEPVVPVRFLSRHTWIGSLYRTTLTGGPAFIYASHDRSPHVATGPTDVTIGYPAVMLAKPQPDAGDVESFATMPVKIRDFEQATDAGETYPPGWQFVLVTDVRRVVGEWEQ